MRMVANVELVAEEFCDNVTNCSTIELVDPRNDFIALIIQHYEVNVKNTVEFPAELEATFTV